MPDDDIFVPPKVLDTPRGHFPSLNNRLQNELSKYHARSNDAVTDILNATRQKTELLEAMAEKARLDLEIEAREIQKSLGKLNS